MSPPIPLYFLRILPILLFYLRILHILLFFLRILPLLLFYFENTPYFTLLFKNTPFLLFYLRILHILLFYFENTPYFTLLFKNTPSFTLLFWEFSLFYSSILTIYSIFYSFILTRAWFVSRAVLKVQSEGYLEKEKINNKRSRTFHDLMDRKFFFNFRVFTIFLTLNFFRLWWHHKWP